MKKNSTYNKSILLKRLYIIDGINEIQTDTNSINKKKTRDKKKSFHISKLME